MPKKDGRKKNTQYDAEKYLKEGNLVEYMKIRDGILETSSRGMSNTIASNTTKRVFERLDGVLENAISRAETAVERAKYASEQANKSVLQAQTKALKSYASQSKKDLKESLKESFSSTQYMSGQTPLPTESKIVQNNIIEEYKTKSNQEKNDAEVDNVLKGELYGADGANNSSEPLIDDILDNDAKQRVDEANLLKGGEKDVLFNANDIKEEKHDDEETKDDKDDNNDDPPAGKERDEEAKKVGAVLEVNPEDGSLGGGGGGGGDIPIDDDIVQQIQGLRSLQHGNQEIMRRLGLQQNGLGENIKTLGDVVDNLNRQRLTRDYERSNISQGINGLGLQELRDTSIDYRQPDRMYKNNAVNLVRIGNRTHRMQLSEYEP